MDALTAQSTEEDIEQFYEDLKRTLDLLGNEEVNIMLRNFKANVDQGQVVVGNYRLGTCNKRGECLIQYLLPRK